MGLTHVVEKSELGYGLTLFRIIDKPDLVPVFIRGNDVKPILNFQ